MPNLQDMRDILYLSRFDGNIEDEEIIILLGRINNSSRTGEIKNP